MSKKKAKAHKAKGSKPQKVAKPKAPKQAPAGGSSESAPWCDTCKSIKELKVEAKALGVKCFSWLKKEELAEAVWCAREKDKGDSARLQELEQLGKKRSNEAWAAWREKKKSA